MSLYVKQWHFTESGDSWDLTKISCITRYEGRSPDSKNKYVVAMDNKESLLIDSSDAKELIQALKQRELDIERIVNTNGNE